MKAGTVYMMDARTNCNSLWKMDDAKRPREMAAKEKAPAKRPSDWMEARSGGAQQAGQDADQAKG